jgi:uncharacterized membrane protein
MLQLVIGMAIFFGVHSVSIFAPRWRNAMAARLGANAWRALYSVVSLAGFLLMLRGYAAAHVQPDIMYTPPPALRHVTALLMLAVFPLLLATYLPGRIKSAVKHPMLLATQVWAIAHLLANGSFADVYLFGGFLAWATADHLSARTRPVRPLAGAPPSRFNDAIAVVGGLVLYVVVVGWAHVRLFGVSPM